MKGKKRILLLVGLLLSSVIGCQKVEKRQKYPLTNDGITNRIEESKENYIPDWQGDKAEIISYAITEQKVMALTFQGLGGEEEMQKLLQVLDERAIKATFFVVGSKINDQAEQAKEVVRRGHQLGNGTVSGLDLRTVDYTQKIIEIKKSHEMIVKHTGVVPNVLRVGYRGMDEEVQLAASQCGYPYLIDYTINPQDWKGKTPAQIANYVDAYKKRGSIIVLNAEKTTRLDEIVALIDEKLKEKQFSWVSLEDLVKIYEERQENRFVLLEDWSQQKQEVSNGIFEKGLSDKKRVALTFDDWATDDTVDRILDTLDAYGVKATFFLRAKGVENNPSLAYAISQRGHEIANHTYSHQNLDTLTKDEIKEEVKKAHEVISWAINKEAKRYLRPPRGILNEEIAQAIYEAGYPTIVQYGPSARDWDSNNSAQYITDYMLKESYNGAILLLHILDDIHTPEALPALLEGLLKEGYEIVTVGELLNLSS
ncbi:polysaccharide deacetylase family protein [Sporanaerobium hydrogeniformans]|uniref:polysaccharide deacetylase family protein n=1 Tax=Sporanaerobium hydrogeniformans TaxID=3072179 RepID=UPI0027E425C6|nr:polysaccharide deacetylase family protein [Sporanaerobium hydrogeniformans]